MPGDWNTFEELMAKAKKKDWIREAIVGMAATFFFSDSRKKAEAAISEWEKVHGKFTGTN